MRRLILSITIALLALTSSFVNTNAARRACDCPTVVVTCPNPFRVGGDTTCTAEVRNFDAASKLTYKWTISAGTRVSDQGTNSIVVDTTGLAGQYITVTVEVGGLPETCPTKATVSMIDETP